MGRKKKYRTEEEIKKANRAKAHRYYLKNAEKIRKKRIDKYYEDRK